MSKDDFSNATPHLDDVVVQTVVQPSVDTHHGVVEEQLILKNVNVETQLLKRSNKNELMIPCFNYLV